MKYIDVILLNSICRDSFTWSMSHANYLMAPLCNGKLMRGYRYYKLTNMDRPPKNFPLKISKTLFDNLDDWNFP